MSSVKIFTNFFRIDKAKQRSEKRTS